MKLSTILNAYFKHFGCLISEPVINVTPKKLNIHIFYYKKDVVSQKFINQKYQQIYSNILRRSIKNRLSKSNLFKNFNSVNSLRSNSLNNSSLIESSLPLTLQNKQINSIKFKAEKVENKLINRVKYNSYNDLFNTDSNDYIHCNNDLRTYLTGMKLKISGRLAKQKVVPKRTVKTAYKGGISENKYNIVESSTFTHKNKKGAFSIRIWLSHGKIS